MSRDEDIYEPHVETRMLTEKQLRLVDEYLVDLNKTAAFHRAGYVCSNPEHLAIRVQRTFKNPFIQEEIKRRQEEQRMLSRYTPLEVMQNNLDFWFKKALSYGDPDDVSDPATFSKMTLARAQAQQIAIQAAPYLHPRAVVAPPSGVGQGDGSTRVSALLLSDGVEEMTPQRALEEYTRLVQGD